jgi:hypothetical protein
MSRPAAVRRAPQRHSRREELEQRRLEKRRAQERQARVQRIRRYSLWGGGALVVALVSGLVINAAVSAKLRADARSAIIPGVVTYAHLARTHVQGTVNYSPIPPVGGPHSEMWLNCGIYDAPVPNENAVHSLEHGAAWITYQPNLPANGVAQLRELVSGQSYVILSPYPGIPSPVVASAWGVQLRVGSASDPRLSEFIDKYQQGPQTPEPGAPCSGGTGTPVG